MEKTDNHESILQEINVGERKHFKCSNLPVEIMKSQM